MFRSLGRNSSIALLVLAMATGTALGYFVAWKRAQQDQVDQFYLSTSLNARALALALTQLRSGGSEKGLEALESQLDVELISLGFYEKYVSPKHRLRQVYRDVAKVREYYQKFPAAHRSPYAAEGLALGSSPRVPNNSFKPNLLRSIKRVA